MADVNCGVHRKGTPQQMGVFLGIPLAQGVLGQKLSVGR